MRRRGQDGPVRVGVGIDTARYGHHVAFVGEDRQEVAKDFKFAESAAGYRQLDEALERIAQRLGGAVHFDVRIDAAGQYASNLEAHLRQLKLAKTISVGEPKRNRDYRNVHFPKRKADAVDSRACARYAAVEQPKPSAEVSEPMRQLRQVASLLSTQRRQTTRHMNQLHNLLAQVFPELAVKVRDLSAQWVLTLLTKYPSAKRIAAARSLDSIPYLKKPLAAELHAEARTSVGSLGGEGAEDLVKQVASNIRSSQQAEANLKMLLVRAYEQSGEGGHRQLTTITGIGVQTAAALSAKIGSIDRFESADHLVGYFGTFPEENTSGVDRHGRPVSQGSRQMSAKGDDLVRGLLWMACASAAQHNPAVRALYRRQRAAGKSASVALGHCMTKLLHLVFAIWKTNKPFDPNHHRWEEPIEASEPSELAGPAAAAADTEAESTAGDVLRTRSVGVSLAMEGSEPSSQASSEPVAAGRAASAEPNQSSPACLASPGSASRTPNLTDPTNELATRLVCDQAQSVDLARTLAVPAPEPVTPSPARAARGQVERKAAGHKQAMPLRTVVTAATNALAATVLAPSGVGDKPVAAIAELEPRRGLWIDFAHVRAQITIEQVLLKLGVLEQLRGRGPQRRGACPIHGGDPNGVGRPFSVNLDKNAFRCMNAACGKQGNALDLWAAARGMDLRPAAIDLARTFGLELAPSSSKARH